MKYQAFSLNLMGRLPAMDTDSTIKYQFRIDRLRWLSSKTTFVTVADVDADGNASQYLIHWNWPLSGQKCRIDAKTGAIIEFSKQDSFGIKIHQATTEQGLEYDFGSMIKERLKQLKEHVDGLNDDAAHTKPFAQDAL